ncbi:MAG: glycosyltransferase family A protein [Cyanobacteria bacterium J06639_1]
MSSVLPAPRVSVVVPTYNVENFIGDTLQSIFAQTFKDFEVLVVIDGSPDRSIDVCRLFDDDPRLTIIEQENRGLAGARNTGIRHARGEYVAFLDGDDMWEPTKLARHVEHLDRAPEVGVSFSRSKFFGGTSAAYLMSATGRIDAKRLLCRNPISNGSTPVVRRAALDAVRKGGEYFDESLRRNEDIDLWLRIACQTDWQLEGLSEALTCYRINAEGLSASFYRQFESWMTVVEKTRQYAPELIESWGSLAKGYQYRALAQKAVMIGDGKAAVDLITKALASDLRIFAEPRGTTLTVIAAFLLYILPKRLFQPLLKLAFAIRTRSQTSHIRRESRTLYA